MASMRHWKERWDPKAPMRFRKNVVIGEGRVLAGSPVTEEHRKILGRRLRNFWESKYIERDPTAEQPQLLIPGTNQPAVSSMDVVRAIARNEQAPALDAPPAQPKAFDPEYLDPAPAGEPAPVEEPKRSLLRKPGQ